jgi:GTP-binding protein
MTNCSFNAIEFLSSATEMANLPAAAGPEIAFSGRSNVGKSSLINFLTSRKGLARTSRTPGRTQMINFFQVGPWRLVDLPGYGYAKAPPSERERWGRVVEAYLTGRPVLAGVVQLVDCRVLNSSLDAEMFKFLASCGIPWVAVLTKTDKFARSHHQRLVRDLTKVPGVDTALAVVPVSVNLNLGRDQLAVAVQSLLDPSGKKGS